ncbi:MAG: DNA gyrase inhibitor YacG [Bryobacteraceae bacterium]
MKCPICKKEVAMDDPYMPFCSERCKLIDLGNWASGKYAIPGSPESVPEDEDEE